jgi:putative tricarboxylic transport membrane protein
VAPIPSRGILITPTSLVVADLVQENPMQIRQKDGVRFICLFFIAAGALLFYHTFSFPKEFGLVASEYGSAFFPRFLLAFIMLIAIVLFFQATFGKARANRGKSIVLSTRQYSRILAIWLLCVIFYFGWKTVGYLPSSFLFMLAAGLVLGVRNLLVLIFLTAMSPLMYLIFEKLLRVGL